MAYKVEVEDFNQHTVEVTLASAYGKGTNKKLTVDVHLMTKEVTYIVYDWSTSFRFETIQEATQYYNGL